MSPPLRLGLLAIVVVLACIEKLCAIMNTVAVERDWVVIIADGDSDSLQSSFLHFYHRDASWLPSPSFPADKILVSQT